MKVECLAIADVKLLTPAVHRDQRGWFTETWNSNTLQAAGIAASFVQDNQAYSNVRGTLRGLHFQLPPAAQDKLVRVISGSILDVAVDLRRGSATFGRHVSVVLTAEAGTQIWVPKGFAHGYVTLSDATEVAYKVTDYYSPACDRGIRWDDPGLGIDWQVAPSDVVISDKDGKLPRLADISTPF